MNQAPQAIIQNILEQHENELLADWIQEQISAVTLRPDLLNEENLRRQSREFLGLFRQGVLSGTLDDIMTDSWAQARAFLERLSTARAQQGFTPSETATFVFSLKQPLFSRLRTHIGDDAQVLNDNVWIMTILLDKLGLLTTELYQRAREGIIVRQRQEILELSTPVVQLWTGILMVPMIGVLDSARTQKVMEELLQRLSDTNSEIAIIDITGVPAVDTQVANHLIKTVTATRLMGADCIISGIRPQIAQTIVGLGIKLDVVTKATLAAALSAAFDKIGIVVARDKLDS